MRKFYIRMPDFLGFAPDLEILSAALVYLVDGQSVSVVVDPPASSCGPTFSSLAWITCHRSLLDTVGRPVRLALASNKHLRIRKK